MRTENRTTKTNAYAKDIRRSIRHARKRFISIIVITLLGVMMFSGLQASCHDLRLSADAFFDAQKLHDITLQSTLGLTDEDVKALQAVSGVETAEGIYTEEADIADTDSKGSAVQFVELVTLDSDGTDAPYLKEGRFPEKADETIVTEKFTSDTGLGIGDTFRILKDNTETSESSAAGNDSVQEGKDTSASDEGEIDFDTDFDVSADAASHIMVSEFAITGIAVDPTRTDNPFSSVSYRTNAGDKVRAFILPEAADNDYYTAVNLRLTGADAMLCYSDSYEDLVLAIKTRIEDEIMKNREQVRTEEVKADARREINDARADAEQELSDAQQKIDEEEQTLKNKLANARDKLDDAQKQIEDGEQELSNAEQELSDAQAELDAQKSSGMQQIASGREQLESMKAQLEEQRTNLQNLLQAQVSGPAADETSASLEQLEAQLQTIDETLSALDEQESQLNSRIASGQAEIDKNRATVEEKKKELASAKEELAGRKADYESGKAEGETKIADAQAKLDAAAAETDEKLADAEADAAAIDAAQWYVQDRLSLSGYSNIRSDADSIESIGTVFPVVFLTVAVLICLTTIARMVDEDRGLIGTYKSLGFTDREIRRKYITFALSASLIGSAVGTAMAFVGFPEFIFSVFRMMYLLPAYQMGILPGYLVTGPIVFLSGVVFAAEIACRKQLKQAPAALMRPKSPRAGSRVLLECATPIWKRMGFLSKVTARNLFRYKGRMFMTIFGVGGCMALMLFGFAIRDSVSDLCPKQYENIQRCDLLAVTSPQDNDTLLDTIAGDSDVKDSINIELTSAKLKYGDSEETVQLIVVPDDITSFDEYTAMYGLDGTELKLGSDSIYVTENAATVSGFSEGSEVTLQLADLEQTQIPVTKVVKNYLSNYVYMTESTYLQHFDEYEPNAVMLHFSKQCDGLKAQKAYGEKLSRTDGVISVQVVSQSIDEFSGTFRLMNVIVSIVIVMSAALAFTVLFTLSAINMSERERELATIKVLGFYDREVHAYINRETWILTVIGILVGVPLGWAFAQTLSIILKLPGIFLETELHGKSYLYAAGLTAIFALVVQGMTNRSLDRIDPATALKSAE